MSPQTNHLRTRLACWRTALVGLPLVIVPVAGCGGGSAGGGDSAAVSETDTCAGLDELFGSTSIFGEEFDGSGGADSLVNGIAVAESALLSLTGASGPVGADAKVVAEQIPAIRAVTEQVTADPANVDQAAEGGQVDSAAIDASLESLKANWSTKCR